MERMKIKCAGTNSEVPLRNTRTGLDEMFPDGTDVDVVNVGPWVSQSRVLLNGNAYWMDCLHLPDVMARLEQRGMTVIGGYITQQRL